MALIKKEDGNLKVKLNSKLFNTIAEREVDANSKLPDALKYSNLQSACLFFVKRDAPFIKLKAPNNAGLTFLLRSGFESNTISDTLGPTIEKLHALSEVCQSLNINHQHIFCASI